MSDIEHTGEMSEWDILVQRIRAMEDPDRDSELALVKATAYGQGYDDAYRFLEADLRENKRAFGRRLERRIRREYEGASRRALFQDLLVGLIMVVVIGALLYASRGVA